MNSYLLRVIVPNIDEFLNKHCESDAEAIELALNIVGRYPLNAHISVYRADDVEGREHKQYIGQVEHVVRRTC